VSASASWTFALLLVLAPIAGAAPKPTGPNAAQLKAQVKKLTAERDELKERLGATENLQQELTETQKSRDLARQETRACKTEMEQLKASFNENQTSGDSILKDLQQAQAEAAALLTDNEKLRRQLETLGSRPKSGVDEASLVAISPEIQPARPMNLNRVTPKAKKVDRGVVVVNILVSENGEVLATRLLQGLPGKSEWIDKANEACVEAAKRLVFDPARADGGKTKVRVWQGVGFLLD
jgi:hypothetical protein